METSKRRLYWRLCYGGVIVLSVLTFTPLVIPSGTYHPMVLGVPYTLWVGILITGALVLLTYGATQFYPVHDPPLEQSSRTND
jgi:hypothetical protein